MERPIPDGPASGRTWGRASGDNAVVASANRSRHLQNEDGNRAIFKYAPGGKPADKYGFGCEWIAYALGSVLGVPVAPAYSELWSGITGALSPLLPSSLNWRLFNQAKHTLGTIVNLDDLPLCAVFDIWIANCDRWDPNLLVQSVPPETPIAEAKEHRFWLIDHGYAFLRPPVKYGLAEDGSDLEDAVIGNGDTQTEQAIRNRMRDCRGAKQYWETLENLDLGGRRELYERVQGVDDATIDEIVRRLPGHYMTGRLVELTVQQIKSRRNRVEEVSERLLMS